MTETPTRKSKAAKAVSSTGVMAAKALAGTGEHPVGELFLWIIGSGILGALGFYVFKHPVKAYIDLAVVGPWFIFGSAFIPKAGVRVAAFIGSAGGAAVTAFAKFWKAFKKPGGDA